MAEPYDLRSNIKNKPGSQGTLFQVNDKSLLNPQQRWPRGYTPERQREVSEALDLYTNVRGTTKVDPPRRATEVRARLQDAISRSTVPAEHLAGLRTVHDQPAPGQAATYWPGRRELAVNMFEEGQDAGAKNLLHELGHHRDVSTKETLALTKTNDNILYAPSGRGQHEAAEAVADNYYVEHYRGPGRSGSRAAQGRYEDTGLADRMAGYREVRPAQEVVSATHRALQDAQFQPGLFSREAARNASQAELQRRQRAQENATKWARGDQ